MPRRPRRAVVTLCDMWGAVRPSVAKSDHGQHGAVSLVQSRIRVAKDNAVWDRVERSTKQYRRYVARQRDAQAAVHRSMDLREYVTAQALLIDNYGCPRLPREIRIRVYAFLERGDMCSLVSWPFCCHRRPTQQHVARYWRWWLNKATLHYCLSGRGQRTEDPRVLDRQRHRCSFARCSPRALGYQPLRWMS